MADVAVQPVEAPEAAALTRSSTAAWRRLRRRPLFIAAALLVGLTIMMAAVPSLFAAGDPDRCDLSQSLQGVSSEHWLGTDLQGCDVYARSVHGARVSMLVGLLGTLATTLLGALAGAAAGYYGGWVDSVLSRVGEVFLAIPLLLGATILLSTVAAGTDGVLGVVLALAVYGWAHVARIMRSSVLAVTELGYVTAARALGASDLRILARHVLPNALAPVLVVATINLGVYITYEAIISLLGLGVQPPAISWGQTINDASERFLQAPLPLLAPATFLSMAVLGFILAGDAIRDALDPKLHR